MLNAQFQPGEIIIAHMYGGKTGERRVVEDKGKTVAICAEEEYQRSVRENDRPNGVGFPRECIERKSEKAQNA